MTIEIIDGNCYEHRQFKMTVIRKSFFQFLKPLLKFGRGFLYTLLADILDVEFIIASHPDLLLGELVGLSESGQLFLRWDTGPVLQLADVTGRKAKPLGQLFYSPF